MAILCPCFKVIFSKSIFVVLKIFSLKLEAEPSAEIEDGVFDVRKDEGGMGSNKRE